MSAPQSLRLSVTDLVAASECVRLMALLVDSASPHAKELAAIIGSRLVVIADDGHGEPLTGDEIAPWVEIGRALAADMADSFDDCPCAGPHCARCGCCAHRACEGGCTWATPTLCSRCV
jgi:hypothetical protein